MNKEIYVINGPNLNLLGIREPDIYGSESLKSIVDKLLTLSKKNGVLFNHIQSNHEGILVDYLNEHYVNFINSQNNKIAFIVNLAAFSHTSIALLDALQMFYKKNVPIFEVHLTDISKRENFRHHSFVSNIASEVIMGLGVDGYEKALHKILAYFKSSRK